MLFRSCLLFLCCSVSLAAQGQLVLGVHTDEPAPSVGEVLSRLVPESVGLEVRPFSDAEALASAVANGDIALALLEEPVTTRAGLSSIAELYPSVLHILYRAEQRPAGIRELLSLGPIWAGAPGGIGDRLVRGLAADYGLDEVEILPDPWSETPAVYFVFGGILARDALARLEGYRLYSLGDPEALMRGSIAEGIVLRYPNLRPFVLPAELYPTIGPEPALTLAVNTLLVGQESLNVNAAYGLALLADQQASAIASIYPLAGLSQLQAMDQAARVLPWHEGAQRYRDRDQPGFLERYAEIIGVSFTVVFALGSVAVALIHRRRQARKDRLDGYYQRLLDHRGQLLGEGEGRESARQAVRNIQQEVFDLVVAERIDADEALVAFLSLSNQLLLESREGAAG